MRKLRLALLAMVAVWGMVMVMASEVVPHFKAKPSDTIEQARANLLEYNQRLEKILSHEALTPEHLIEVHQMTYTLEVALAKLQEGLQKSAESLEEVHKGSEEVGYERVRTNGRDYLEAMNILLGVPPVRTEGGGGNGK